MAEDDEGKRSGGIAIVCEKRHDKGEPDIFWPAVFCDVCGERIEKAGEGNAYWRPSFDFGKEAFYATRFVVAFAHKKCDRRINRSLWWMDIEDFVAYLARNLEMQVTERGRKNRTRRGK